MTSVIPVQCFTKWAIKPNNLGAGARFSKAPETFRARKAIFSSSVSKIGEAYTPETRVLYEGNLSHIKNMWVRQLCNHKVRNFAVRKLYLILEERAPGQNDWPKSAWFSKLKLLIWPMMSTVNEVNIVKQR